MSRAHDTDGTAPGDPDRTPATGATSAPTEGRRESSMLRSIGVFLREIVIVVALAVVLSLVAKTWLVQTFWIPSESMMSTLVPDDRVLVSKLTPGPFDLERGDIVVFEDPGGWLEPTVPVEPTNDARGVLRSGLRWVGLLPEDKGNHLVKRVIGLPGDRVVCCTSDGKLSVNGTAVTEPYLHPGDTPSDKDFDITVPEGKLWVMGDHRSRSADSRYQEGGDLSQVGTVPIDHVVGRAFTIVWPLTRFTWLGEPKDTFATVPDAAQTPPAQAPSAEPSTSASTGTP